MLIHRKISGFSLLELGLVLVILSLLLSGMLTIATQNIRIAKQNELEVKMQAIEEAIIGFRKANGYMPCPGDVTLAVTNSNFGKASDASTNCTGGTPAVGMSFINTGAYDPSGNVVVGAVPVRTIGLPDDYSFDPWGGKFLYVIDSHVTTSTYFTPTLLTSSTFGNIIVKGENGTQLPNKAVFLLLSHGPNGHGSFQRNGTQKFVGSTNTDEQDNCGCSASALTGHDDVFRMHRPTQAVATQTPFDDIVHFYTRTQLLSDAEEKTDRY